MVETYRYRKAAPLSCPISVFGGADDTTVRPEDLAGWHRHSTEPFTLRTFPGGHFFLNTQRLPVLDAVARDVLASLAERTTPAEAVGG
jgi:surfactin synthase thioesterase subunit